MLRADNTTVIVITVQHPDEPPMTMHLQELYVNMAEGLDKIPPVTTANSPRRYDGPIMVRTKGNLEQHHPILILPPGLNVTRVCFICISLNIVFEALIKSRIASATWNPSVSGSFQSFTAAS